MGVVVEGAQDPVVTLAGTPVELSADGASWTGEAPAPGEGVLRVESGGVVVYEAMKPLRPGEVARIQVGEAGTTVQFDHGPPPAAASEGPASGAGDPGARHGQASDVDVARMKGALDSMTALVLVALFGGLGLGVLGHRKLAGPGAPKSKTCNGLELTGIWLTEDAHAVRQALLSSGSVLVTSGAPDDVIDQALANPKALVVVEGAPDELVQHGPANLLLLVADHPDANGRLDVAEGRLRARR